MFESRLELLEEVVSGSEGNGGAVNGIFSESVSPGQGRPFSHIREGEGDFLRIVIVGSLVDCKVELDGMHPGDSRFVRAIKGLRFAELELGGFDGGGRHGGRDRWVRIGGRQGGEERMLLVNEEFRDVVLKG